MQLKNNYGHFSDDGREFIITDPRTPRPWFNYIWNDRYAGLISHTGGGFSFLDSPRDNRLTRMRYNCLPWDRPGRYVILKDVDTERYWSLSWAPTIEREYAKYECAHGQGYTRITTEYENIRGQITYFVPRDLHGEVWRVSLKNLSTRQRRLQVFSFVELLMGNALNDIINQPNDKHFTDVHFDNERQALVATRRYWVLNKKVSVSQPNIAWEYKLYFTQTLPIKGFDGSLDKFIGRWRSEANPECIERGAMFNSEITAGDPVAALQSEVALKPGETLDFAVILTVTPKEGKGSDVQSDWQSLRDIGTVDKKLDAVKQWWSEYLGAVHVQTPDEKMNLMLNVWNQYQAAVTFDMARNSGFYHGGLLFGTGLRDQFQDILGYVIANPARVRARILNALRFQFEDGSTLHNFFKLTDTGEKTNHSDTPLWIPFGIVEYLNETGDFTILDEHVNYYESDSSGTVYEHMIRAIDYPLKNLTPRGLPKIMNGDWNDTLDKIGPEGKGETVWGAMFLAAMIMKTFDLLETRNDLTTLSRFKKAYDDLGKRVNDFCWDGEWYIRAFRDDGRPVGVHSDDQGKIFINSQSWSIISGLATKERGAKALESLKKYLAKPKGIQICWPSFTHVDNTIGLISRCVAGKKENGAIFNHASSWAVLALLLHGDIEYANKVYSSMLPLNSACEIDRYEVEPYVYAEYVTSPDHPTEGQASHSWLTGTAVWMLRLGIDYILGLRTGLKGITLDPRIPSGWKTYTVSRKFRGKQINLIVKNPNGKNSGVRSMIINGKTVAGNSIDLQAYADQTLNVEVTLE
jgi:cellobiose phosphorylase